MLQAQLRTMHWIVDHVKRLPGGYTVLEQVLSASVREAEQRQAEAASEWKRWEPAEVCRSRLILLYQSTGRSKRKSIYKGPISTPETGCEHGDPYNQGLCKSCWERWKRSVRSSAPPVDQKGTQR